MDGNTDSSKGKERLKAGAGAGGVQAGQLKKPPSALTFSTYCRPSAFAQSQKEQWQEQPMNPIVGMSST
jgi:hypothetical protein